MNYSDVKNGTAKFEPKLAPQHRKILDFIQEKGSLTTLEAAIHLKITKLPTRMSELRRMGYTFHVAQESGDGTRWNRYSNARLA